MQRNALITLAIILIFFCSCVAFLGGMGIGYSLTEAGQEPPSEQPEPAAITTYEPPERPAQRGVLLLEDDFSQKEWQAYVDNEHRQVYEDGRYVIGVEVTGYTYWSTAGDDFSNFIAEVETTQISGPDDNDYGLILRYQDEANFYSFEISGDGFYTFVKYVEDELFEIIPWQESHHIHQGNQTNTLRVEAVGPNFTFYINDALVDAAIDSEFSQGDVGLLVGTYDEPGVTIAFDNLKVWAVEEGQ